MHGATVKKKSSPKVVDGFRFNYVNTYFWFCSFYCAAQ